MAARRQCAVILLVVLVFCCAMLLQNLEETPAIIIGKQSFLTMYKNRFFEISNITPQDEVVYDAEPDKGSGPLQPKPQAAQSEQASTQPTQAPADPSADDSYNNMDDLDVLVHIMVGDMEHKCRSQKTIGPTGSDGGWDGKFPNRIFSLFVCLFVVVVEGVFGVHCAAMCCPLLVHEKNGQCRPEYAAR
jgi:hypothetical protein